MAQIPGHSQPLTNDPTRKVPQAAIYNTRYQAHSLGSADKPAGRGDGDLANSGVLQSEIDQDAGETDKDEVSDAWGEGCLGGQVTDSQLAVLACRNRARTGAVIMQ